MPIMHTHHRTSLMRVYGSFVTKPEVDLSRNVTSFSHKAMHLGKPKSMYWCKHFETQILYYTAFVVVAMNG